MEENRESGAGADREEQGRFGRAREFVGGSYTKASDAVRDGYNTVREKVEDLDFGAITDQARAYVRSNPGKALLISVAVGFVVGMLLRRVGSDEED